MYTSPVTPTGAGRRLRSSTCTRVFPIGAPIGGTPGWSAAIGPAVVITVVSVGPYVFHSRAFDDQVRDSSAVSRSAPTTQFVRPATWSGSSTASSDGTTLATVTPLAATIAASAADSERSGVVAIASVPPPPSTTAMSSTAASKLNDANCSATTPSATPSTGRIANARFTGPRCGTCTPLGRPVDPEV